MNLWFAWCHFTSVCLIFVSLVEHLNLGADCPKKFYWAVFPVQVFHGIFGFLGEWLNVTKQYFPLAAVYYVVRGNQVYL